MNDEIKKYGDPNLKPKGIYRKTKLRRWPESGEFVPWGKGRLSETKQRVKK